MFRADVENVPGSEYQIGASARLIFLPADVIIFPMSYTLIVLHLYAVVNSSGLTCQIPASHETVAE